MKVLTVFGTRPVAIKMAPLVNVLAADPGFEAKVCVTAQHREMLDQVLDLFDLQPDIDLDMMKSGWDLSDITSNIPGKICKTNLKRTTVPEALACDVICVLAKHTPFIAAVS